MLQLGEVFVKGFLFDLVAVGEFIAKLTGPGILVKRCVFIDFYERFYYYFWSKLVVTNSGWLVSKTPQKY